MQPCDELKNIVLQNYRDHASPGGSQEVVRRCYSHQEGVLFLGTDPKEWLEGYKAIYRYVESAGGGGMEIGVDYLEAWCEGPVGWTVDRIRLTLPDGTNVPVRHTHVFQKEGDAWKIVHTHVSVEIPDEILIKMVKQSG